MAQITKTPLAGDELQKFNELVAQLDVKVADRAAVRAAVQSAVEAAKYKLGAPFGGAYPDGAQIGVAELRPYHLGGSVSWATTYTTTGWNDYVINNVSTLEDHWAVVWEIEEREAVPKATEMEIKLGPKTFPIIGLRALSNSETNRVPLPKPIIITPKQNIQAAVRVEAAGREELRLVGVVVSTGANLMKRQPT